MRRLQFSYRLTPLDNDGVLLGADQLGAGSDGNVLFQDAVLQLCALADDGVVEQDAVLDFSVLSDGNFTEQNGVFHLAVQHAAVSDQAVLDLALVAVVGGNAVTDLGVDGVSAAEQVSTDILLQQIHGVGVVLFHRLVEHGNAVELVSVDGNQATVPATHDQVTVHANVYGIYHITKAVLPYMVKQNSGDVIMVASTAGLAGNASTSAYSASKFAVIGMSESIMKEVRKNNVRVSTLTPSTIVTDMSKSMGIAADGNENILHPEDFAELVTDILKMSQRALIKNASIWSTNP